MNHTLQRDLQDWDAWITEIEDRRLVAKSAKMDIDLDDFPLPPSEPGERPSHYVLRDFGNRYLAFETRRALKAKMREKAQSYRKEQREFWELVIKVIPFLIGLVGVAIGLVATLKK